MSKSQKQLKGKVSIFVAIEESFPRIAIPYVNRDSARSQTIFNGNRRIDFSNTTGNVQSTRKSRWEFWVARGTVDWTVEAKFAEVPTIPSNCDLNQSIIRDRRP